MRALRELPEIFEGYRIMNPGLKTRWLDREIAYTGPELRPHWILSQFKIQGSAVVAFRGPCEVKTGDLVDWEDRLAQDCIRASEMVHFMGEFFGPTLREGVWMQRLFISILAEVLRERFGITLTRTGDDLWVGEGDARRKLSVSIVTSSAVSQLLHIGINVDPAGAPVPAVGLLELGVEPTAFAREALSRFAAEMQSVWDATTKVMPV
jgi:hypothetical protein